MLHWASVHWALAAVRWAFVFFSLFFLLLLPCDACYPSQLSRRCPLSVPLKRNSPVVESCFSVGLIQEPREGWIVTSSMLTPHQANSAKESSNFHVHGSHIQVSLAWSFPSPCFGRLCSIKQVKTFRHPSIWLPPKRLVWIRICVVLTTCYWGLSLLWKHAQLYALWMPDSCQLWRNYRMGTKWESSQAWLSESIVT